MTAAEAKTPAQPRSGAPETPPAPPSKSPLRLVVAVLSSLRLTVVLLVLGILVVFFGTLGQTTDGLYVAQDRYFRSWFSYFQHATVRWFIVPLPGGYLLGTLLVANLIVAHFTRFKFTWRKSGIMLTHFGIILLLLGQLATDMFARESQMRLSEGESKNYSEASMDYELAVIDVTDPQKDSVITFPQSLVARQGELRHPQLPFSLRLSAYAGNSDIRPRGPMAQNGPQQATKGLAQRFEVVPAEMTYTMETKNVPMVVAEVVTSQGSLGTWLLTPFGIEEALTLAMGRFWEGQLGETMGARLATQLRAPQEFELNGRTYQLALRPVRFYTPHALTLVDFSHKRYMGTEKARDFRSRVQIENAASGDRREVDIYMNNPLRYAGLTYYQSSFDRFDPTVTVLQVVKNPSWLTPYAGCGLVALGLVVQFMIHLVGFIRKRRAALATA